jgi:hypothetical protein
MTPIYRTFIRTIRSFHLPLKKQCNLQVTRRQGLGLADWTAEFGVRVTTSCALMNTICLVVVPVNEVRAPRQS